MPPMKPKPGTLASKLTASKPKPSGPLWLGPSAEGWNGGVTQSMIKAWLSCRERFRVKYVEGWRPQAKFHPRMDYGNLWHICEEYFAANKDWEGPLVFYCRDLIKKYPLQQVEINHWFEICRVQFPLYVKWWESHPEVVERTPLLQEYPFDVKYRLPSGRVVRLRGKFDGVDLIGQRPKAGIWLFETKTKGDIDELEIQRNLQWDLQTMLYLVALQAVQHEFASDVDDSEWHESILGVRYNVIRRPLSGGKGSIKQGKGKAGAKCSKCDATGTFTDKKNKVTTTCPKCLGACRIGAEPPETDRDFFARLGQTIEGAVGQEWEVGPDENYFFRRWTVTISPADVERFRRECLDPILEAMCRWYDYVKEDMELTGGRLGSSGSIEGRILHWRHPSGAENNIDLYGASDVDEYINHGSTVGLVRSEELFNELKT